MSPSPLESADILDLFGNAALHVSFSGLHDGLSIIATSRVETLRDNPFDYLVLNPRFTKLPAEYDARVAEVLSPNLHRASPDPRIDNWASQVASTVRGDTQSFLLWLTEEIHREYQSETRPDGAPNTPSETFDRQQGACRDLAVLFMDACRSQGIASRFVSGYVYEPTGADGSELHAWSEVYLPGGGWRGYDPSRGVVVADRHVPIAVGPTAEWAAPTEGCYIGSSVDNRMIYEVSIVDARDRG